MSATELPSHHGQATVVRIGDRSERHQAIVHLIAQRTTSHATLGSALECLYSTIAERIIADLIGSVMPRVAEAHEDMPQVLAEVLISQGESNLALVSLWGEVSELLAAETSHKPLPADIDALRPEQRN